MGPSPYSLISRKFSSWNWDIIAYDQKQKREYGLMDCAVLQLLSFYYYYYYHDISPSALSCLTRWPAGEWETMSWGWSDRVCSAQDPPSLLLLPVQLTLNTTIGTTFRHLGRSVNNGPSHADQSSLPCTWNMEFYNRQSSFIHFSLDARKDVK